MRLVPKLSMMVLLLSGLSLAAAPKVKDKEFVIYTERGDRSNHYIPSGWMGDFGDLKFNQAWPTNPGAGKSCIQIKYTGERKQGAGWTGIYWQHPANNWGDKKGGFDLSGYKTLTFMARGEKGGELIDKFMIGGITGQTEDGDSDNAQTDSIELTKDWKQYSIDLSKCDLKKIIGGFGFALNSDSNPSGATFYVDEIKLSGEAPKKLALK